MLRIVRWFSCVVLGAVCAVPCRADVFQLRGGGQVEGELANADESPRRHYVIDTVEGAHLVLERSQVLRVARRSAAQEEYLRIRVTHPDTVAGQWALAQWCREHRLATERRTHLERVVELDPDHAAARRALGYSRVDGQWKTTAEVMAERGYILHNGKWLLPQQVEIREQRRKNELAEKEWSRRIERWHAWLHETEHAEEALAGLSAIDDPYALPALKEFLLREPEPRLRELAVEAVARVNDPLGTDLLVDLTLADPDLELRRTALEHIARAEPARAVERYVRRLKDKSNDTVNLAAAALGYLRSPAAVAPLIDALVTRHKFVIQEGNGSGTTATFVNPNSTGGNTNPTNAGFFGGNPGGMTMGGGPKVINQSIRNRDVLDALVAITRQNFEFDLRSWKMWFASQKNSESLDARRDEAP